MVKGLPDFTTLVDAVGPSVVNIRTMERVRPQAEPVDGGMDPDMQEFFRRFFGAPFPGMPQQPQQPGPRRRGGQGDGELRPSGVGSGFILTADGFIMTNAHVVDGADEVLVTLADKRELKAKVVGLDKRSDVAVVKVQAGNLPAVKVGDVNQLKVGEWVIAIGSPFGLENTVTAGIVSAKQRDTGDYLPFIQTDVAINPGNSGGPLINMRGEVVGINSQIYSRSGGYMGISFSIPMDEAMRVSDQIRANGHVTRGRVGVQIDQVSPEVAESIGLGKARGALVRMVEAGGPAEKAGLQAGDIIVQFDGKPIDKASDLPRIVGNTKPGTKAEMQVFRRGTQRKLTVTVGELPADTVQADSNAGGEQAQAGNALGLRWPTCLPSKRKSFDSMVACGYRPRKALGLVRVCVKAMWCWLWATSRCCRWPISMPLSRCWKKARSSPCLCVEGRRCSTCWYASDPDLGFVKRPLVP